MNSFCRFTHVRMLVLCLFVLAFTTGAALAQTSNGTIAGVVTDASGAVIVNATVTATSPTTGESRSVPTTGVGGYRIESVSPGIYSLTVSAPSFAKTVIQSVQVNSSVLTSVNVTLKPGSSETVNVEANAEVLQTENGEISHNISSHEILNLPLAGLNPYALATTLPGVTTGGPGFTNGTGFVVNGARPRSNNFLIEGQDNNDAGIKGQGLQPSNLGAVKEVTVLTNSYSSEFGFGAGSVSNLIYKSGTNTFHGSAWDLHANSALEANNHANNLSASPKEKYHENIFGFDFGGPIKRDKLFFYASHQWDKYRSSTNGSLLTVPTAAGVATLQSLPSNPRITALLTAIDGLRGLTQTSTINIGSGRPAVEIGRVRRTGVPLATESPELDLKGDYIITTKDTLNLRYVRSKYSAPYDFFNFSGQYPGFDATQFGASHNAGITYTHIFSASLVNELRMSYGRIGFTFDNRPETYANPLAVSPTISGLGITGWGANGSLPQGRFHNTYQLQDAISWTRGAHTFKFGADLADIRVRDAVPFNFYGGIGYAASSANGTTPAFTGLANYIDNFGGKNSTVTKTFGSPVVRPSLPSYNIYFQDNWRLRSNLTASLGLRYEYPGAPGNALKYPAMDMSNPNDPGYPKVYKEKADTNNFGPRVSLAWSMDQKTVIRSGFGVFYDGIFTNILDNTQAASPNSVGGSITSIANAANPRGTANWSSQIGNLNPNFSLLAQQTTMDHKLVAPKTLQWNFNIQREMPAGFMLEIGYVGTRGMKLFGQSYLNPFLPTGLRLIPTRGAILSRDNSGDSVYHGLDAKLEHRVGHGLLFRASYTFSHNIDDVSEIFTTGNYSAYPLVQAPFQPNRGVVDRANSAYDRRHRLVLAYVYQIPNLRAGDNAFAKGAGFILHDWLISGTTTFQTGGFGNVEINYDENGDGINNDRPNIGNPSAPITSYGWQVGNQICDGVFWYNTSDPCHPVAASSVHWIVPDTGQTGNLGRNTFGVPGTQTWNFDIARSIKIHERHSLEYRAEFFNIFNHANTGMPNLLLTTGIPQTGTITFGNLPLTVSGNRAIRMWLKYSF